MATRYKNTIRDDKIENDAPKPDMKNKVSADAGTKGARYIPYDETKAVKKEVVKSERPRNVADKEITNYNANRKVRNVNMPRDIPALTQKTTAAPVVNKIADKVADKVVSKAADKAPATAKEVIKKVVKSAPSELDSYKSANPALKRQFADNSRLAQAVRSSDYGNDEDTNTQMRINEAADFFKKRGVNGLPAAMKKGGVAKKLAKGGAVSLKPITGKALKPLSSKSITAAAKGMAKAVKPARPAKAFAKGGLAMKTAKPAKIDMDKPIIKAAMKVPKAKMAKPAPAAPLPDPKLFKAKGGAVKCSKSSKAIDGCAKKGLTRAAKAR